MVNLSLFIYLQQAKFCLFQNVCGFRMCFQQGSLNEVVLHNTMQIKIWYMKKNSPKNKTFIKAFKKEMFLHMTTELNALFIIQYNYNFLFTQYNFH